MATIMRSIFQKIGAAKASQGGNYIRDGEYLFAVRKILIKDSDAGSGVFFVAELDVIESTDDPNAIDKEGTPQAKAVKANAVGSTASLATELLANKSGAGNAKAFILGLIGYSEEEVTDEEVAATIEDFCKPSNPARGMLVRDSTYRKKIKTGKNVGDMFTNHKWINVPQTADEIAARRATLDAAEKAAA